MESMTYDSDNTYSYTYNAEASKMPELKITEVYDDSDRDINSTDIQTYVINAPVTRSYYYDPYGGQWNEDNGYDTNPFRYAGEQWDRETGSIYLRARFYSPGTGRFMTVDPIKDGENWYAYCAGNPVMFRDPSGLKLTCAEEDYETVEGLLIELSGNSLEFDYQDGEIVIVKEYDTDHRVGQMIIKNVIKPEYDVVNINIGIEDENGYVNSSWGAAGGTESGNNEIYLDPCNKTKKGEASAVVLKSDGTTESEVIPDYIIMGHELIHVMHFIYDKIDKTNVLSYYNEIHNIEEFNTTGINYAIIDDLGKGRNMKSEYGLMTENGLRLENGLNKRIRVED